MTKWWGGGIPTSVEDYYSFGLCRILLCKLFTLLLWLSSRIPSPGLRYRTTHPILTRLNLTTTSHLHGVHHPPGNYPYLSHNLQTPHGVIRPHGRLLSLSQNFLIPTRLPPMPPPAPYCAFLSSCHLFLVSHNISSKIYLSCVSVTSCCHNAPLLSPPP